MPVREMDEESKELEQLAFEARALRDLKSQAQRADSERTGQINLILERKGTETYDGEKVLIERREYSLPRVVDPSIAYATVPQNEFFNMVEVNRETFEAYLEDNGILLRKEDYLVSPGKQKRTEIKIKELGIRKLIQVSSRIYNAFAKTIRERLKEKLLGIGISENFKML